MLSEATIAMGGHGQRLLYIHIAGWKLEMKLSSHHPALQLTFFLEKRYCTAKSLPAGCMRRSPNYFIVRCMTPAVLYQLN